jgi:hypothetical protein
MTQDDVPSVAFGLHDILGGTSAVALERFDQPKDRDIDTLVALAMLEDVPLAV